jgi:hypothetical protein
VDTLQTVDQCMNRILDCVNGGALPNGLNDLYNPDVRHAIVNGMMLCAPQVDSCITHARVDCNRIFNSMQDVWITFNSRVIQPSYYSFILRNTGLTPNQAENTCLLLDRNVYGTSFAAVSAGGNVTTEFNNQVVPHNQQGGNRNSPLGVRPNTDPMRGHYARWDATTGQCLVRVGAYLNNSLITNDWLFGIAGDDRPAEAWVPAGDSFTCGRRLFEFSLYNWTQTMAVTGVVATGVGAGIGAWAGSRARASLDCEEERHRTALFRQHVQGLGTQDRNRLFRITGLGVAATTIEPETCIKIEMLADVAVAANEAMASHPDCENDDCFRNMMDERLRDLLENNDTGLLCHGGLEDCVGLDAFRRQTRDLEALVRRLGFEGRVRVGGQAGRGALIGAGIGAGVGGVATAIAYFVERNNIQCRIGDGLDSVAVDRNRRIDSLRDFYVKWALQLPDTITPTALVTDCASWRAACGTITDVSVNGACVNASINFRQESGGQIRQIDGACVVSGSICIENRPVARVNGACDI